MDAPIHFAEGANTTDQVPVDQMIGPGFVIDVSAQAGDAVDYLITAADIEAFEALHGPLPAGAIVLLNTGRSGLYFPQSGLKPPTLVGKTFKRAPKALMNH